MARQRYRKAAIELMESLEEDPNVEIISLTDDLYFRAMELFRQRPDKEWGITDCISFVLMQDHEITDALTTDDHFKQAGFRILLTE